MSYGDSVMVVSKCPICNEALVGYAWTKTPKGKNWLKKGDEWHDCPSKQFKKKTAGSNKKLFGTAVLPESYDRKDVGYYCTAGHYQGNKFWEVNKISLCAKCGVSLAIVNFKDKE